jgi:type IV pilus assembly protein PilB
MIITGFYAGNPNNLTVPLHKRLGDVLIDQGLVTPQQIVDAVERQSKTGRPLGEIVRQMGAATEQQIAEAVAEQQDVLTWDLTAKPATPEALDLLSPEFCIRHQVLPVHTDGLVLVLAMLNAGKLDVIDQARKLTKLWVQAVHVADKQLAAAIEAAYGAHPDEAVNAFVTQALGEYNESRGAEADKVTEEETRPVIGLVNQIIADAIRLRASDVHLEPREKSFELRYRVDGRLIKIREIPLALMRVVTARIKIMADLDVADNRLPQDGRIAVQLGSRKIDLRVSILPIQYGSRTVFRILDRTVALRQLDELGFNPHNVRLFRDLIEKPYGIVLVTGPTGSGKTTTLYAALNELREEATNIITCEDPIEYQIPGISQSQVHEKIGLTFAAQLRSILRQDPDIVLVGEMRDQETAEIAIRAAMTGHLVLSTLHCNDAPGAIPRLADMGVLPYLVATSLIGVVAQRLLRVLCPECKQLAEPSERDLLFMNTFGRTTDQVWQAVGCEACNRTGFRGRMAVHEVLPITEEMGRDIATGASVDVLRQKGLKVGYRPMQFDAWDRIEQGLTTLDECRRLIFFDNSKAEDDESPPLIKAA